MSDCKNTIDSKRDRIINAEVNTNFSSNEQTSQHFITEQLNNNGHCMVGTTTNRLHEIASNDVDDSKQQICEQVDESTQMTSPPTATTTAVIKEVPNRDKYISMDNNPADSHENLSYKKPTNSSNESNQNETMPARANEKINSPLDTGISPSACISDENDRTIVSTTTDVHNGPANNLYV